MKRFGVILLFLLFMSFSVSVFAADDVRSRLNKIDLENTDGNGTVYSDDEMDLILRFMSKNYDKLAGRTTDEKFQDAMRRYDRYKTGPIRIGVSLLFCVVLSLPLILGHFYKKGGVVKVFLDNKVNWSEYEDIIFFLESMLPFKILLILVFLLVELHGLYLWIGL